MKYYDSFYRHTIIALYMWVVLSLILFFITEYTPIVIFTSIIFFTFIIMDYIIYRIINKEVKKEEK